VQLTVQTQIFPAKEQATLLEETLRAFNAAASWLAEKAFELRSADRFELQKLFYVELRERFGLSSQMAVRCIAQVCGAYKRDLNICSTFRDYAALPYDQRTMTFKQGNIVSLLTMQGRTLVPVVLGAYQAKQLKKYQMGQCDLIRRKDGKWFLHISITIPEPKTKRVKDVLGVDLGVTTLACDSDGFAYSGTEVETCRVRYGKLRASLQQAADTKKNSGKRPKNIRRRLKRLGNKESRFRKDMNHRISKELVLQAKGTKRAIALEDLTNIRTRTRFRKAQRNRMGGWAFSQLRLFITYKALMHGVRVILVDPAYTSQTCSDCGTIDKKSRISQAEFVCTSCGYTIHADWNGSINIRKRALVNAPKVSEQPRSCAA